MINFLKKTVVYLAYLFISVSLILLSIEGAGRLYIHFKYGIPGKTYGLWIYDADLGATHRPNGYNTHTSLNNYGFRNHEDVFDSKPRNSIRIIAFGGSTTFGYNLGDDDIYTEQLQRRLRTIKGYDKTQVLNAGRICYSAGHNLILIKRLVPKLKPDYVIIYEGVNEAMNMCGLENDGVAVSKLTEHYGMIAKSYDQNRWIKRNSVIARYFDYVVKQKIEESRKRLAELNPDHVFEMPSAQQVSIHPWAIENYKYVLKEMLDFLRKENVSVIVVRYACVQNDYHKTFSDISAQVAREKDVLVYDMEQRFDQFGEKKKDYFIYTGVHVTPDGAKILAGGLFDLIMQKEQEKRHGETL